MIIIGNEGAHTVPLRLIKEVLMTITKKQLRYYALFFLIAVYTAVLFIPIGHAAGTISEFPASMLKTINEGVIDTIRDNLTSNGGQNKFYAYMVSGDDSGGASIIEAVINAVKAVAGFIVIIISVSNYFQNLERGTDPTEGMHKLFIELFLTGFLVINIDVIMSSVVGIGEWLIDVVLNFSKNPNVQTVSLTDITGKESGGALWWIESVVILIIPWILSLLMGVIAQFMAFSILIELGIRRAFAPFAVADIYHEGLRSPGVRYLKRYLATFLKICICIFVCYLGQVLMGISLEENVANFDSIGDIFQYIFRVIAINVTVLGVMAKTGEYANDIVGV